MEAMFGYMIAIVFIVIAMNFFALIMRMKKTHIPKPTRAALEEERAAVIRDNEVRRRIEIEQDGAERHVALRNKTLELYDYVRKRAEAAEKGLDFNVPVPDLSSREHFIDSPGLWTDGWGLISSK